MRSRNISREVRIRQFLKALREASFPCATTDLMALRLTSLLSDPFLTNLRGDPRYKALLRKLMLPT